MKYFSKLNTAIQTQCENFAYAVLYRYISIFDITVFTRVILYKIHYMNTIY